MNDYIKISDSDEFTKPYYEEEIRDWINTPEENRAVKSILRQTPNEIWDTHQDLNELADLDPAIKRTHSFNVECKAVIRQCHKHRRAGLCREHIEITGPTTIGGMLWDVFKGIAAIEVGRAVYDNFTSKK